MRGPPGRNSLGAVALVCLILPWTHSVNAADLVTVYQLALTNDPTLAGERDSLEVAQARVTQARSALLPSLAGNTQAGRTGGPVTYTGVPTVDRDFNNLTWTLQLTMPVIRPQLLIGYRQSHQQVVQSEASVTLAEQDLIVRVAKGYFDVLTALESVAAADAEVKATEEQQSLTRRSYERGISSITDVDEAKARAESARASRISAQTEVEIRRAELEKIAGPIPTELAPLSLNAQVPLPDPPDPARWIAQARENHPSVLAYAAAVEVARLEVEKARVARLPTLDVIGSFGRSYSSGNNTNPLDYATNAHIRQGVLQLNLPILDGGSLHAQVAEARARQHKAEADLEGARRQAAVDARSAYESIVNGISQIKALRSAIDASDNSVKGNQAGYRLGLRINTDVLQSQRERYAAQRDLARVRYEAVLQGLKLKSAVGTLQLQDIRALNTMLVVP